MTDVQISGADRVVAGLTKLLDSAEEAQRAVIRPLGDRYVQVMQDNTPVGRGEHPGRLRASYQTDDQAYSASGAHYRITNTTPYLRYVLNGRPGVTARPGGMLRFVIGGVVFFRKSVGPAAANNFPPRVRQAMQGQIDAAGPQMAGLIVKAYRGG